MDQQLDQWIEKLKLLIQRELDFQKRKQCKNSASEEVCVQSNGLSKTIKKVMVQNDWGRNPT